MLHVSPLALKFRVQVTASYVSPAIQELHVAAAAAGICIMNEVGVDPGMRAVQPPFAVYYENTVQSVAFSIHL
jgi:saccharopine dehydrogenase-like NADP-dependent oxidoreductase